MIKYEELFVIDNFILLSEMMLPFGTIKSFPKIFIREKRLRTSLALVKKKKWMQTACFPAQLGQEFSKRYALGYCLSPARHLTDGQCLACVYLVLDARG